MGSARSDLESVRAEFWRRVSVEDASACWFWSLSSGSHGYGQWWPTRGNGHPIFDGNWLTHRMAWFLTYGPIPPGWTVDHRCRVRRCCNPRHLRLRTNADNAGDNGWRHRTFCPAGHPYDQANTYVNPRGWRSCRVCARARKRKR